MAEISGSAFYRDNFPNDNVTVHPVRTGAADRGPVS
jgi:hypothetical protein